MGALSKRQKEQAKYRLPECNPTEEQQKYYNYCVNKNIIISPIGINATPAAWRARGTADAGRCAVSGQLGAVAPAVLADALTYSYFAGF